MNRPNSLRRGAAMAMALMCLIVVIGLSGALLVGLSQRRAEVASEERQVAAVCLADSGLARAAAQLRLSSGYQGESWKIAAEELGGRDGAVVTIRIEPVADAPTQRKIIVAAEFAPESERKCKRSREVVVALEKP